MTGNDAFDILLVVWTGMACLTFVMLLRRAAPYGRYASDTWGPTMPHRIAWMLMETLSPLALVVSFLLAGGEPVPGAILFMVLWILHYANRSVVYPLRASWESKRMPVLIMLSACLFNVINGSINGAYFGSMGSIHSDWALFAPASIAGLALWILGAGINIWSDERLFRLRRSSPEAYQIPAGGLFDRVSCPNYLGECIQWAGFALLTWSPAALTFAVWTAANLVPRALSHHNWYRDRFPDYPDARKAILPGIL